jgi:hypothetical protein
LLWADPEPGQEEDWAPSDRGISKCFSKKVLKEKLELFDMDCVVRGHQVCFFFFLTILNLNFIFI